jgi:chemotaxis protein MotB
MKKTFVVLLTFAFATGACVVPKKKLDQKQSEVDSCFKALAQENEKKKQLADATADLQNKLSELTKLLDEEQKKGGGMSAQVDELQKELQAKADEVQKLQTEKEELAKKSATYDQLVSSLQNEIDQGKIKITEAKNRLSVELIDKVLFDSGSTEIKPEGQSALEKVAGVLRTITDKQIMVEGHTDNVPLKSGAAFPTNWELSVMRATTVVRFLQDKGVDPSNLGATGFSQYRPIAGNDSDSGRHANRRIEIVLTPKPVLAKQ